LGGKSLIRWARVGGKERRPVFEHFPPYPFYRIYQGNQVISIPENSNADGNSQRWEHHVHVSEIVHIGKEANNIEDEPLEGGNVQVFSNKEKERLRIVDMRQCDAEKARVDRKTFQRIKERIRKKGWINLKTNAVRRLVNLAS